MECFKYLTDDETQFIQEAADKQKAIEQLKTDAERKKANLQKSRMIHTNLMARIEAHPEGPITAFNSMMSNDLYALEKGSNVEYRQKAIEGLAHQKMADVIQQLSTRKFGFTRDEKLGDDFVKDIMGGDSGNANSKALAKQAAEAMEMLRERANKAGADIGKLESWGMPQSHDQLKVSNVDPEEWIEFTKPLLVDNGEGLMLHYINETIRTNGANKLLKRPLDPTSKGGRSSLANKLGDPRTLHFKNAESWLKYQKRFGESDPLTAILDHVRGMSNDIALLEIFGPNPEAMFETLHKSIKAGVDTGKYKKQGYANWFWENDPQRLFNVVSGRVDAMTARTSIGQKASEILAGARNLQVSSKLGSAQLSAITDIATVIANSKRVGLEFSNIMKIAAKNLDIENQKNIAEEIGLTVDIFNSSISSRYSETVKGWTAQTAEAVIRAQGMAVWTEAIRKAYQAELYNHMLHLKREHKTVPELFEKYGFTKKTWDELDFENLNVDQHTRILEIINQEADYGVMMPTARTRAYTTGGHARGSLEGETFRTTFQFKSFPITFMLQQGARTFLQDSFTTRFKFGLGLFTMATILGAFSVMSKDASKGYTPRDGSPLSDKQDTESLIKFWSAAAVQGGGAGILGDFFFSDQTRFGNSKIPTFLGPTGSTTESFINLTYGNIQKAGMGKDTHVATDAIDFVNREISPLNLWYTKAAIEFVFINNAKHFLDKDYKKKEKAKEKKRKKEYGQEKFEFLQD